MYALTSLSCTIVCQVFNVEIALDLSELNALTAKRQSVRDKLEKAIAAYEATNVRPQVTNHIMLFLTHAHLTFDWPHTYCMSICLRCISRRAICHFFRTVPR